MALGQKEIGRRVSEFTSGLASSASDLMLFAVKYNLDLQEAGESITEIGLSSFKRSLTHLKSKGLVTESQDTQTGYVLTEDGNAEVEKLAPSYRVDRDWNGKVYLINYDLPVTKNSLRNAFRDFIKSELGCGMLQHSLWLTTYDPREKLVEYMNKNELAKELAIVSAVSFETETYPYQVPKLVEQAFSLSSLNQEYQGYISRVESAEITTRSAKIFEFLKILKGDPQVPYDLIPEDWSGYKAHELFKQAL